VGLGGASAITALPANDIGRAKRFYADKLGLTPVLEVPARVLFTQADGSQFLLFPTPTPTAAGIARWGSG
jgi:catechol 2,3-dioxygenase-like lactoylglutathione lyase family enzyme